MACRLAEIGSGSRFPADSQWEPTIWKETMSHFTIVGGRWLPRWLRSASGWRYVLPHPRIQPAPISRNRRPLFLGPSSEAAAAPGVLPDAAAAPGRLGPTGAPQGAVPDAAPMQSSGDPTRDACDLFNKAVNYAAINYEDFADYSAGSGNFVNYDDQTVGNANLAGRTALKQAAGAALNASGDTGCAAGGHGADALVVLQRREARRRHGSSRWRRHPQLDSNRPQQRRTRRPNGLRHCPSECLSRVRAKSRHSDAGVEND